MASVIKIRRDTASNWATNNPVLASGEQGYETDTGKIKIGNNTTAWNSLSYQVGTIVPENAIFTDTIYDDTNVVKTTDIGTVTSAMLEETYLTTHQDISGKLDKNTPITAGTATKITYDADGLVTGGTSLTAGDIPDLSGTYLTSETSHADVLVDSDIGVTVQGYDADTVVDSNYIHTDNNYTTIEKSNLANQSGTNTGDQDATTVNLVGYSKPATTGSIGTTDSTQIAIGKLEKGLESAVAGSGEVNVQSDWSVTDTGSDAYILNKPVIPTVPTSISAFTNDSGYITDYTVTELDVTAHEAALTITESQISDFGSYEASFTKNTGFNKNFGTTAGTVAQGNDSRILNGQTAYNWGDHSLIGYITDYTVTSTDVNTAVPNITTQGTITLTSLGFTGDSDANNYVLPATVLDQSDIGVIVQAYDEDTTLQGNIFNGAEQLVKLDATGKLPGIDGSNLTAVNATAANTSYDNSASGLTATTVKAGLDELATKTNKMDVTAIESVVFNGDGTLTITTA